MKIFVPTLFHLCFTILLIAFIVNANHDEASCEGTDEPTTKQVTSGGSGGYASLEVCWGLDGADWIQLRGDKRLDAIILIPGPPHEFKMGGNGGDLTHAITLEEGEYFNYFSIRGGRKVDRLSLGTNLGQYVTAGGDGGTEITRSNIMILSMKIHSGTEIDKITIFYKELGTGLRRRLIV